MNEPDIVYTEIWCQNCETQIEPASAMIFVSIRPDGPFATAACKNAQVCAENKAARR